MLKIGLLSPFLPEKDGIAIYSDNLLKGLGEDRKHIVAIGRRGSEADYIINFKSFSLKKNLERIIKKENLDLIHIQYVPTLFGKYNLNYNLINALNLSIPTIVTLHEVHYSSKGIRNKILACIEKNIIKKADKIIVHTPKQKEFLEKKYKTNKIVMIYHGLRLNKISKSFEKQSFGNKVFSKRFSNRLEKRSFSKRKNKKNILCFGLISHGKGIPYLIKAMKYLPDYNLTIVGKFVDEKTKKEVAGALKKSGSQIKTDFRWIDEKNKERYYQEANIVVLPHIWAPYQSGILHNAVAWGLPVVAKKVGALYEMVELFKFGEIVKPKNPSALAKGIGKVFENYSKYKKGIVKYRRIANWQEVAHQHLNLYGGCDNQHLL